MRTPNLRISLLLLIQKSANCAALNINHKVFWKTIGAYKVQQKQLIYNKKVSKFFFRC